MYQAETSADLLKKKHLLPRSPLEWTRVGTTVLLLGATSLFADVSAEMVSTTLPIYLLVTLQLSPFQIGLTDGIYQGAAILVRVISGMIADRWRKPKHVAAAGYAMSAACRLGLLIAGSSWIAISSVTMLDRIGKGIRTAPRDAMIAASNRSDRLATAFGVHRAMDTAGAMLGPLLAVVVLAAAPQGYDAVFVVSFCVALIGVAIIVLFVKNPAHGSGEVSADDRSTTPASVSSTRIRALLRQKEFRVLIAVGSALSLVTVSDSLLYLALQQRMTFAVGVFPLLYVVTALSFMVLAIPMGRLADRIGHRRVFLLGYGLLFAAYALLLSPIMNGVVVVLMLATLGAYYAATDGVLMALASRLLPPDMLATGLALVTTGTGVARLLASMLYGVFWERSGADVTLIFFALALIGILCAVSRTILRTAVN